MSTIGERLKRARENMNLKQTQVKERTGINNKTLSGYEKGVSEPDAETMNILAELYGVSVDWITGRVKEPKQILSKGAKGLLDAIELTDEAALKQMKNLFVHRGKELTDEALKEILSYARYKADQEKQ